MPVSKEQLAKIIGGKARELCSPEGDRMISEARNSRNGGGGYDPNPNEYDDYEQYDRMYLNEDDDMETADIHYTRKNADYSNLPENIKESLIRNPIDRSSLSNVSVLDSMDVPKKRPQKQRQRVNEENYRQNYQPSQNGIDYSLIKAIVSECITEYFERSPLNESTLKTIGLKEGKITLVDNKGNTYMAKLEKIGNVNNKRG